MFRGAASIGLWAASLWIAGAVCGALAAAEPDIERLVDELVDVAEPGFGYSELFSGTEFLPNKNTGQMQTRVFGASSARRSATLRKIVELGAESVPVLLKHLNDDRTIKMPPLSGLEWIAFPDEYDFNRRTAAKPPQGVNRDHFGEEHPNQHALAVGDLCFVALGQIVNRNYCASRYQPSGGTMVNSPTYSAALRKAILDEWSGLTEEQHKQRLIDDFRLPDHEDRRVGAYWRLSLYYPEAVESLVLEQLSAIAEDEHSEDRPLEWVDSVYDQASFIDTLVDDKSRKVGDAVVALFLERKDDDVLAPACLRYLANTGYVEFLVEQLSHIDISNVESNVLHCSYIEAIATSHNPAVHEKLRQIVATTRNDAYFMAALVTTGREDDEMVLDRAKRLLADLPDDSDRGRDLLSMIHYRFPDQAQAIYKSFLATGSANRADTMCNVLCYGNPIALEILAPLLDDQRLLPRYTGSVRVCDRAARAISHQGLSFNCDWRTVTRDRQIEKIKQFCKRAADSGAGAPHGHGPNR